MSVARSHLAVSFMRLFTAQSSLECGGDYVGIFLLSRLSLSRPQALQGGEIVLR
jgi:hypothetical protein